MLFTAIGRFPRHVLPMSFSEEKELNDYLQPR